MSRLNQPRLDPVRVRAIVLWPMIAQLLFACARFSTAQQSREWTERENYGFKGPVRSVLTTVAKPNPDPRREGQRKLFTEGTPDWALFDTQGRRIEYGSIINGNTFGTLSKCTFHDDGTRVCSNGPDRRDEFRRQETTLADGRREVTLFQGAKLESHQITRFDENGRAVAFHDYDGNGKLRSEESVLFDGDDETRTSKSYDADGEVVLHQRTLVSNEKTRFDRWFYDSEGRLVWHLALNDDGNVLSSWCDVGYKPKQSPSGSLGICRPRLCIDYKFDEAGSGRMEKTLDHTSGEGNLEPDSQEHYNLDGILDEKAEFKYQRDGNGNWISRSVFVWDVTSTRMVEIERDTRTIEYY